MLTGMSASGTTRVDEIVTDCMDYYEMSTSLRDEARDDRLIILMADIMSMMITPGGDGERFTPFMTFTSGSSFHPGLLKEEHIALLRPLEIQNAAVRARVCDILWEHSTGSERVGHAQSAIDAYLELAADAPWHDAEDYLARAHDIASRFNGADKGVRAERVRDAVRQALQKASAPAELISAARLLRTVGVDEHDVVTTVAALDLASIEAKTAKEFAVARGLLEELLSWKRMDDSTRPDVIHAIAELWVQEADLRMVGTNASSLAAASFIENAIQTLRSIPRRHRSGLGVDERISALRSRMKDLNEAAMDEMSFIKSDAIDLSAPAEAARAQVSGHKPTDALLRFASMLPLADETRDRTDAEKRVAGSISSLFATTSYTHDGRVSDKSTAEDAVDRQMGTAAQLCRHLHTIGMILPALLQLREEHTLRLPDFLSLTRASAVVPPDNEGLIASGLYAGWNLDMGVAAHVLVPRMEAIVRYHLKSAGVATTHLDADGREDELSLPALLDKPETAEVLGNALVYELQGLYAGRFGSNLRHDIAHGLATDATSGSVVTVYAWWLTLRLVLVPFFDQKTAATDTDASAGD